MIAAGYAPRDGKRLERRDSQTCIDWQRAQPPVAIRDVYRAVAWIDIAQADKEIVMRAAG